jgi:AcrR family transcriptional regulator
MEGNMTDLDADIEHETPSGGAGQGNGSTTRSRILQIALTLMSQRGVDGTSMRDLASAAGLNVASLYHYFPSKRDLLESVLVERGFLPEVRSQSDEQDANAADSPLEQLLSEILISMFEVEDFVRLMVGEAMREVTTARAVGLDLFTTFQESIEEWIRRHRPDLDTRVGAPAVARMLGAVIVGVFMEHATGVLDETGDGLTALAMQRAKEAAQILSPLE